MPALADPCRYRIILRGECEELVASALGGLVIESCRGWTAVVASVRDESELYGLLDRFRDFVLHIVSLNELGADVLRPRTGGQPPVPDHGGGTSERLERAPAGDHATSQSAVDAAAGNVEQSGLDMRAHAMVRLAALVAAGEPETAYVEHAATAIDHGVTLDEIVGVLAALLPTVSTARVTAASAAILGATGRAGRASPATDGARLGGVETSGGTAEL